MGVARSELLLVAWQNLEILTIAAARRCCTNRRLGSGSLGRWISKRNLSPAIAPPTGSNTTRHSRHGAHWPSGWTRACPGLSLPAANVGAARSSEVQRFSSAWASRISLDWPCARPRALLNHCWRCLGCRGRHPTSARCVVGSAVWMCRWPIDPVQMAYI